MSKQSGFIQRLQAQQAVMMARTREDTIQFCSDGWIMAINEVFHRKGKIVADCLQKAIEYTHDIAETTLTDTKDLEYTRERVDEALKDILGEYFQPWEERYR